MKQLTIVIADDKSIELDKLRNILEWEKYDAHIVGEARNGKEALRLCETLQPNLLITDIRMPVMDGIQLTKQLAVKHPEIQIIYLSSYDEFRYAQQAISLSVRGYLLKPYTEQDIVEVLLKILEETAARSYQLRQQEEREGLLSYNLPLLQQAFLLQYLREAPNTDQAEFWRQANTLGIGFRSDSFVLFSIKVISSFWQQLGLRNLSSKVEQAVSSVSAPFVTGQYLVGEGNRFYVLYNLQDHRLTQSQQNVRELERLLTITFKKAKLPLEITPSNIGYGIGSWHRLYEELELQESVPKTKQISFTQQLFQEYQIVEPEILQAVSQQQAQLGLELLEELLQPALQAQLPASHIAQISVSLLSGLLRLRQEETGNLQENTLLSLLEEIAGHATVQDMLPWAAQQILLTAQQLGASKSERNAYLVRQVIDIIEEQYRLPMSVADISGQVHMSLNYLRSIFKQQTGYSLSAYLSEYRLQQACNLLENTTCKISDIPEQVGLTNSPYFYFLFKKHIGVTPGEYRESHQLGQALPSEPQERKTLGEDTK